MDREVHWDFHAGTTLYMNVAYHLQPIREYHNPHSWAPQLEVEDKGLKGSESARVWARLA